MVMEEGVEKRQNEKPPPLFPSVIIYDTVWVGGSNRQGAESCFIKCTVKKKTQKDLLMMQAAKLRENVGKMSPDRDARNKAPLSMMA